jgi:hypothetical protein
VWASRRRCATFLPSVAWRRSDGDNAAPLVLNDPGCIVETFVLHEPPNGDLREVAYVEELVQRVVAELVGDRWQFTAACVASLHDTWPHRMTRGLGAA